MGFMGFSHHKIMPLDFQNFSSPRENPVGSQARVLDVFLGSVTISPQLSVRSHKSARLIRDSDYGWVVITDNHIEVQLVPKNQG